MTCQIATILIVIRTQIKRLLFYPGVSPHLSVLIALSADGGVCQVIVPSGWY